MKKFKRHYKHLPLLGIDISNHAVKIIELCKDRRVMTSCIKVPYSHEDEVVGALKYALDEINGYGKHVGIALPNSQVITQTTLLDATLNDEEIFMRVYDEASKCFNISTSELLLDFKTMEKEDRQKKQVFWIAAKRVDVEARVVSIKKAGLKVAVVEVASFSLQRAYKQILAKQLMVYQLVALANFDETSLLFVVLKGFKHFYTATEKLNNFSHDDSSRAAILQKAIKVFSLSFPNEPLSCVFLSGKISNISGFKESVQALVLMPDVSSVFPQINEVCVDKAYDPVEFVLSIGLAMRKNDKY